MRIDLDSYDVAISCNYLGKKYIYFLCFKIVLVIVFMPVFCSAIEGRIMQVKDGDTVVVAPAEGGQFFICRLHGIDAPETARKGKAGQPYGDKATKELKLLILGQVVNVEIMGRKTYNRKVCIIRKGNMNVNLEMVSRGYAWAYVRYLKKPHASEYIDAESKARAKRLGLWNDYNPIPPWIFRKQ